MEPGSPSQQNHYQEKWRSHNNPTSRWNAYDQPALCIPRSVKSMSSREIEDVFNKSGLGVVNKVVVKSKRHILNEWEQIVNDDTNITDVEYSNIYVYFKKWNIENPAVREYREKLLKGQTIKVVFESIPTPIFWKCSAARFRTSIDTTPRHASPVPIIMGGLGHCVLYNNPEPEELVT